MELLRLRRRTALARKGHKLLKDKLDGLVRRLLEVVKKHQHLSSQLEQELIEVFQKLVLSSAQIDPSLLAAITKLPSCKAVVDISIKNIMGVKIPDYQLNLTGGIIPYGPAQIPVELDQALAKFKEILVQLVELAEQNKIIIVMASQIIEIKRRVNALEYILIPELESAVRFIRMKLSEMERSNTVTLLKIKDIVQAH